MRESCTKCELQCLVCFDGFHYFWYLAILVQVCDDTYQWSICCHTADDVTGVKNHCDCWFFTSCLCFSKFWTRNRPGDKMRDRYNLNLLPGMSEDGLEYGEDGNRHVCCDVTSAECDPPSLCFRWHRPEQCRFHPRDGHSWAAEGCHGAGTEQYVSSRNILELNPQVSRV